jgi:hypothetical protein
MQAIGDSDFLSGNTIDSTGSIYCQSFGKQALDNQFLNLKFINYSQNKLDGQFHQSKNSGKEIQSNQFFLRLEYSDLILIILLAMFACVAFVRFSGKTYFNRLFMSIKNYSYSVSFFREKNLAFVLYHNILMIIFYISTGLLASIITTHYNINIPHTENYIQLLISISVCSFLILINRLVIWLSGIIFGYSKLSSEYLFYYGNWLKVIGILFMLLSLILFYLHKNEQTILIYFTFFIIAIAYLVKTIRIFIIFNTNKFSLYYLILYFCALEIIPIILLVKIFNLLIFKGFIKF